MKLKPSDINKLEKFLEKIKSDTYPELPSDLHTNISIQMFDFFKNKYQLPSQAKILDIGCGQGVALELFIKNNFNLLALHSIRMMLLLAFKKDLM